MAGCCCRMQLQFQWCHQSYSLEEEGTLPPTPLSHSCWWKEREQPARQGPINIGVYNMQMRAHRTKGFSRLYTRLGLPDSYGALHSSLLHNCHFILDALYLCFLKISTRFFWLAEEGTEPPSQTLSLSLWMTMTMQKVKVWHAGCICLILRFRQPLSVSRFTVVPPSTRAAIPIATRSINISDLWLAPLLPIR